MCWHQKEFQILLIALLFNGFDAKYIEGVLKSDTNWQFLTNFCFLPAKGSLQFILEYPKSHLTQSLLLYYDKPGLWNGVYRTNLTCQQKESQLNAASYQIFRLSPDNKTCKLMNNDKIICSSPVYRFKTVRERWWYFVISNCAAKHGLLIKYSMWLRNGEEGNLFREHFSADELYILEASIAFSFLHLALFIAAAAAAVRLHRQGLLHSTYKMFSASALLSLLSCCCYCAAYTAYGIGGSRLQALHWIADSLHSAAVCLLTFTLTLLSVGQSVTCGRLPACCAAAVSCLSACLALSHASLIVADVVDSSDLDSSARLRWRWSGWPAYCLLASACANCLFYSYCCLNSLMLYRRRRRFYLLMSCFYIAWLTAYPACGAANATLVPAFMRVRLSACAQMALVLFGQAFYLLISLPVRINSCRPYRIKVNRLASVTLEEAARQADAARSVEDDDKDDDDLSGGGKAVELGDGTTFTDFSLFTVLDQSRVRLGQLDASATNSSTPQTKLLQQTQVYEEIGDADGRDVSAELDRRAADSSGVKYCVGARTGGRQEAPIRQRPSMGVSSLRRWQR